MKQDIKNSIAEAIKALDTAVDHIGHLRIQCADKWRTKVQLMDWEIDLISMMGELEENGDDLFAKAVRLDIPEELKAE
ncbi:MAG: hypothetical protein IIW42_05790 [Bacteroidaceae bacterium]|nr:hypothetical protein [Bacteroidaceae bacterium]